MLFIQRSSHPLNLHSFPTRRSSDLRIVPGYYHRLNRDGNIETSSCCPNTASEHNMMEKLLIDSVLVWARDYKRSEEHTSELQSLRHLVCRLLLEKKKKKLSNT